MSISLTLPVRTWAALDAALEFFREAPRGVRAAQALARRCRRLHEGLQRLSIHYQYITVGATAPGKTILRLRVRHNFCRRLPLTLALPQPVVRSIAEICHTIIHAQKDLTFGELLDHEAEELQAARAFLSELRRRGYCSLTVAPTCSGQRQLRWDEARREYGFTGRVAQRVHAHYLRAGAPIN